MAHSFDALYHHAVFTTKYRGPLLDHSVREELYRLIADLTKKERTKLIIAGGTNDHVHMLMRASRDTRPCDVMRTVKAQSSAILNAEWGYRGDFAWQEGYGIFSVSPSARDSVHRYIANQEAHHANESALQEVERIMVDVEG
jgi:putative transposase